MALRHRLDQGVGDAGFSRRSMSYDGCLYNNGGLNVTTATTGEEVLVSLALPRNLLHVARTGLYLFVVGTTKNNGNNKQVRIRLGASSITGSIVADTGAVASNNGAFVVEGWILTAGAASSELVGKTIMSTTVTASYLADTTTAMPSLAGISINGITPTAAGDLTLKAYRLMWLSKGGVQTTGGVLE